MHGCSVAQLCPILCDPMDCSPPGSSVCGIPQARILEWVAVSSSRASSWPRDWTWVSSIFCIGRRILYYCTTWEAQCMPGTIALYSAVKITLFVLLISTTSHARMLSCFSCVWLCNPMDVARQAPLSMGFSRQEYWSGLPCPPPGDLPDSEIKLESLMSLALTGGFFTTSTTWEALQVLHNQP